MQLPEEVGNYTSMETGGRTERRTDSGGGPGPGIEIYKEASDRTVAAFALRCGSGVVDGAGWFLSFGQDRWAKDKDEECEERLRRMVR